MDLPELPLVRRFILPDSGHVFCHRDYNQQELRILAHFEDGALMRAYLANPRMDTHDFVRDLILEIANIEMQRRQVKIINFQKIYGGGVPAISSALDITVEKARQFIAAHAKALPGIKDINDSIKAIVKAGEPIVTWGGRRYYPEEPKMIMGRMREFTYKLINYLIQGSAADCTKEALIRFSEAKNDSRFLVTVYDEINISAPRPNWRREMNILKECMEGIEFDVPMLTDGKFGKNWADLKKES
jgi:DNA polymerase-1